MVLEADPEKELQSLLAFLYMAPVGVVQMTGTGEISLINPMAANLLMPLRADGTLTNLFEAIDHSFPEINSIVAEFDRPTGVICKAVRFAPFFRARQHAENKTYELTLLKVDAENLMGMLTDVTDSVMREEQLRLGAACYNAALNDHCKYGIVGLDSDGNMLYWNDAMKELTGFSASQVIGKPCSVLFKDGDSFSNRLPDLLHDVTQSGWTLQNEWCTKADGSKFWASYIISVPEMNVLHAQGSELPQSNLSSYVVLIRDINQHVHASGKMTHATSCVT